MIVYATNAKPQFSYTVTWEAQTGASEIPLRWLPVVGIGAARWGLVARRQCHHCYESPIPSYGLDLFLSCVLDYKTFTVKLEIYISPSIHQVRFDLTGDGLVNGMGWGVEIHCKCWRLKYMSFILSMIWQKSY